jgi:hypothetical protein
MGEYVVDDRTKARLEELDAGQRSAIDRIVTDLADAESWERLAQRAVKRLSHRRHPVGERSERTNVIGAMPIPGPGRADAKRGSAAGGDVDLRRRPVDADVLTTSANL